MDKNYTKQQNLQYLAEGGLVSDAFKFFGKDPEKMGKFGKYATQAGDMVMMMSPLGSARDLYHDVKEGNWGSALMDAAFLIPGAGAVGAAAKTGLKLAKAGKAAKVLGKGEKALIANGKRVTANKAFKKAATNLINPLAGKGPIMNAMGRAFGFNNMGNIAKTTSNIVKGNTGVLKGAMTNTGDLVKIPAKMAGMIAAPAIVDGIGHSIQKAQNGIKIRKYGKGGFGEKAIQYVAPEAGKGLEKFGEKVGSYFVDLVGWGSKGAEKEVSKTVSKTSGYSKPKVEYSGNNSFSTPKSQPKVEPKGEGFKQKTEYVSSEKPKSEVMALDTKGASMSSKASNISQKELERTVEKQSGKKWSQMSKWEKAKGLTKAAVSLGVPITTLAGLGYAGYNFLTGGDDEHSSGSSHHRERGSGYSSGGHHRRSYSGHSSVPASDYSLGGYDSYVGGYDGYVGGSDYGNGSAGPSVVVLPNEDRTYTSGTNGYYVTMPDPV